MAKGAAYCFSFVVVFLSLALVVHSYDCTYVVSLKTGTINKAGTHAKVLLRLHDNQGHSVDATDLSAYGVGSKDHYFKRGQFDKFNIPGDCFPSPICIIELSHNNGGSSPAWYVEYLEVAVVTLQMQNTTSPVRRFNINQWLAKDEPPYSLSVVKNQC
ncbi:hypothetical protein BVRB_5g119550 [Beta vulgaris subsp. vulgaris]|nr:hypothetical protein BVRB_5g119550 [Beta vulgaris subsp. vulgaris]